MRARVMARHRKKVTKIHSEGNLYILEGQQSDSAASSVVCVVYRVDPGPVGSTRSTWWASSPRSFLLSRSKGTTNKKKKKESKMSANLQVITWSPVTVDLSKVIKLLLWSSTTLKPPAWYCLDPLHASVDLWVSWGDWIRLPPALCAEDAPSDWHLEDSLVDALNSVVIVFFCSVGGQGVLLGVPLPCSRQILAFLSSGSLVFVNSSRYKYT